MSSHILVVEDEADLADALAFALEREGFTTTVARDSWVATADRLSATAPANTGWSATTST
jgi:DNA-binding response OmpR family regulator